MKLMALSVVTISFPVAVWFATKMINRKEATGDGSRIALRSTSDAKTRLDSDTHPQSQQVNSAATDVNAAADVTMKKISKMHADILQTRGELMRREEERKKMTEELKKIQVKISEILNHQELPPSAGDKENASIR
jgi:peptidoglycan hydrolase CwlO-like protein